MSTGQFTVKRHQDREGLLAIRNEAWPYEQLLAWAEQENRELHNLVHQSPLLQEPDRAGLDQLC
ncbi:MAG: hypothetical protein ACRERD_29750, partial [Candidatus Binatia bacterium]